MVLMQVVGQQVSWCAQVAALHCGIAHHLRQVSAVVHCRHYSRECPLLLLLCPCQPIAWPRWSSTSVISHSEMRQAWRSGVKWLCHAQVSPAHLGVSQPLQVMGDRWGLLEGRRHGRGRGDIRFHRRKDVRVSVLFLFHLHLLSSLLPSGFAGFLCVIRVIGASRASPDAQEGLGRADRG